MKLNSETYVVFVAFITSFFAVFLSAGIVLGVPAIASEFAMNNVIQNWITTLTALVIAVFTLPAGQISGKYGVKKSLIIGVSIFLLASIGACVSFSTEMFMMFRVLQGIGIAFSNVSAIAMVVQAVKPENRESHWALPLPECIWEDHFHLYSADFWYITSAGGQCFTLSFRFWQSVSC